MDGSISLSADQRNVLLRIFRNGCFGDNDVVVSRRAQVILLLANGHGYRDIREFAFASFDFIAECVRRFRSGGIDALCEGRTQREEPAWLEDLLGWLLDKTPEDFGYIRSRWSCATLAEVLAWEKGVQVSAETVRRALHRVDFVWRRPRPVLGRTDPDHDRKMACIHELLETLPEDETAVFQDEVDVHLNPKIGSCWMPRGEQAEVVTPGDNVKRHLAGSIVWRTGTLLVSAPGTSRNAALFVAHLDDLRRRLRTYRVIHVICDNAKFHDCHAVRDYLAVWGHRIRLHYLPKYAPNMNPIERVWWRMHERVTRNHRCPDIDHLLDRVYGWIGEQDKFTGDAMAPYANAA
jgi:putative transposase